MSAKLPCQEVCKWLKANLGPKCLAPLTSTDARCLYAAVQILDLYNFCDQHHESQLLAAFASVVRAMQRSTQELVYHSIAMLMEWHSREEIWRAANLDPFERVRVCAFEPGGSGR